MLSFLAGRRGNKGNTHAQAQYRACCQGALLPTPPVNPLASGGTWRNVCGATDRPHEAANEDTGT